MKESSAWQSLRDALHNEAAETGLACHITRIENAVGAGVFDTNLCFYGTEMWLEGKYLPSLPKRASTKVKVGLREAQKDWGKRRYYSGGHLYVWVRVGKDKADRGFGWYLFDIAYAETLDHLYEGISQQEFSEHRVESVGQLAAEVLSCT